MKAKDSNKVWYKKRWGIVLAVLIWPFFVGWYIWKKWNATKRLKWAATGGVVVLSFMSLAAFAAILPPPPEKPANNQPYKPVYVQGTVPVANDQSDTGASTNSSTPAKTPAKSSQNDLNKQAAQILTDGTNYFVQLFQQGQSALGSYQYPDSTSALADLSDPSSAASKWSKFHSAFATTDYTSKATDYYNQASNLFSDSAPSAIGDWNYDINTVLSDIGQWQTDATNWQTRDLSASQLNADVQQYQQDLAAAKADIAKL